MTPDPRAKKLAAALAAVQAWLAQEAAEAAAAVPRRPRSVESQSAWALAGRLQLIGSRMALHARRRGTG